MDEHMTDAQLRAEADGILYGKGILERAARYGKVHVRGSYALQLMAWKDLDIAIAMSPMDEVAFRKLGDELIAALSPTRVTYHNRVAEPMPGMPKGFYYGFRLGDLHSGGWKIDLWAMEPGEMSERISLEEKLASRLTDETRKAILAIKAKLWTHPEYRKSITSQDIYRAVLDGGVADVDGFWRFIGRSP
jgi:hypothetical protein